MRRFSSYGPINTKLHFYAPREDVIEKGLNRLVGEDANEGGHYITTWAPRQCGKTWVMREIVEKIKQTGDYEVGILTMELAKMVEEESSVLNILVEKMQNTFEKKFPPIKEFKELPSLFTSRFFKKPVILVLDEFDALEEQLINRFAGIFRDIFLSRTNEINKPSKDKTYLLHGLALIGVRSVLGIENQKGSPFNVQRSLHVNNLRYEEVESMFRWYEKESGQKVEDEVIRMLFRETMGQPGLTCWFGELLTEGVEGYEVEKDRPINKNDFEIVYAAATYALPNNNILNIISKAREEPNKTTVIKMFRTDEKLPFRFDDKTTNALYMNGVVDKEIVDKVHYYLKFSCPFVQKRLFNYFSYELFNDMGTLVEPFTDLGDVITPTDINIPNLLKLYQKYLRKNKDWLFKAAPRRSDMKIYEAIYHFNVFSYLSEFLRNKGGMVYLEFPTGNGKIDLLIKYKGNDYGLELKSYTDQPGYRTALEQAAQYGIQLNLKEIFLLIFVPAIDDDTRKKHEVQYRDKTSGVTVTPVFVETGN